MPRPPSTPWLRPEAATRGLLVVVMAVIVGSAILGAASTTNAPADPLGAGRSNANLRTADPWKPATIVDADVTRADPFLLWDPVVQKYRMYTTQDLGGHLPMWLADNVMGPWQPAGDALPVLPEWASDDFRTWAPEVANINGTWTMWGSAGLKDSLADCLFRATAPTPTGPFVVDSATPRLCDVSEGGAIDPHMIQDDSGTWWLTFKANLNVFHRRTRIDSVQLGRDGLPTGQVGTLIDASQPWMHDLIESPSFLKDPVTNRWWLIFSAGFFAGDSPNYRIAAVPCADPRGPCSADAMVTLVSSNAQGNGPGEQSLFTDRDGTTWMSYNPSAPYVPGGRPLAIVQLGFDNAGVPFAARRKP